MGQLGSRHRAAARIADHRGKIADNQNGFVAQILKIPQLAEHHTVTEMDVRGRRIDAQLYPQRLGRGELGAQFFLFENLFAATAKVGHLVIG